MDALSDLLRVVRFTGGVFLEANFRAPWCVRAQVSPEDCGPGVKAEGGLVAFHYVLEGRMQVRLGNDPPRPAGPGAIILLSHNDPHLLGSNVTIPALEGRPLMRKAEDHELAHIDFGTGRRVSHRFVCGFLATPMRDHPLLAVLPSLLVSDLLGRASAEWAASSFRYAAREHASRRPGSQAILARLAEVLFVEAVRGHIEELPGNATGWLAALRDPSLSRALSALHLRPAHLWTAEALAREACLSRSAFADRFTSTIGLPPMSYLTRWRMLLAGQRLRESADTITQISAQVGYESEFTFSRAFRREMGMAPGAWRRRN
ncbi:MAG: AraC family transcriptional regulator [Verrucomicrobiales bacterium]|nr:AraC family transcriptional regulator [Verrucomicrobiales bacterium]